MTSIVVDPHELTAVAATLRNVARETAAVGSGLAHCTQCAMPPETEAQVNELIAASDRVLDELARRLQVSTNDLLQRALVATLDSLAVATAASTDFRTFGLPAGMQVAPPAAAPSSTDFRTFGLPAGVQVAPAPVSQSSTDFRTFGLPAGMLAAPAPAPQPTVDFRMFGYPPGADPATFRLPPSVGLPSVAGARLSHNALVYATNGTEMLRPILSQGTRIDTITHAVNSPLTTTIRPRG